MLNRQSATTSCYTMVSLSELHVIAELTAVPRYLKAKKSGYEVIAIWSGCSGNSGVDIYTVTAVEGINLEKKLYERNQNWAC